MQVKYACAEFMLLCACRSSMHVQSSCCYAHAGQVRMRRVHAAMRTQVKYACAEFMLLVLKSERSTDEALRIRRCAELYSLTDLQHEADRVIASAFASVARSTAFLESSLDEVLSLLRSDYILEPNE